VRLSETERIVSAYANGLDTAGAAKSAAALRALAVLLSDFGFLTTLDFAERAPRELAPSAKPCRSGDATLPEVLRQLEALEHVLREGGAEAAADDMASLLKQLDRLWRESHETISLASMLDALRRALRPEPPDVSIKAFVERLNKDMRTPAFEQTFDELEASRLKREHVVEIARAVYGGIPKNTSRKAALRFIRKPHDAYMSAKRGIEATGGRSAA
jgi:hypothetical protein